MRWQPGEANTNRKAAIVVPGKYQGRIQFADEVTKHNKIRVTMDLDDGRRVRFNIAPRHGGQALAAIGKPSGQNLEAEDLVGQTVMVELDQWSPDDDPDRVFNTLKSIDAATSAHGLHTTKLSDVKSPGEVKEASNEISEDDIPF